MKKVLFVGLLACVALSTAAKKKLAITMTGENLATLTQVTDNQALIHLAVTMVLRYSSV